MHRKLCLLLGIVLLLTACSNKSANAIDFEDLAYEQVIEEIEKLEGEENPLFDKLSIEITDYQIEDENDFERRLEFTFLIKNLTNMDIDFKYIGFLPEELEQYYLSRNSFESDKRIFEKNFDWEHTASILVQHPENLQDDAREYLESKGEKIYFAFEIDGEIFYYEFTLSEGFANSD
ncbi:hypothetical protein SAMN04488134_11290 [Amphibacillus marinus]|uniref:Lipoprotein n=1 Tax=Amphibacillus marinus TaxID=872970 RepID=A0A1H8SCN6_9BACI|nr:hypothetical protein [Amphibacillus marinus]SEO76441.1 hypothetical protein SAMN04488134_11290 [Amphibacillus marinus]